MPRAVSPAKGIKAARPVGKVKTMRWRLCRGSSFNQILKGSGRDRWTEPIADESLSNRSAEAGVAAVAVSANLRMKIAISLDDLGRPASLRRGHLALALAQSTAQRVGQVQGSWYVCNSMRRAHKSA